MSDRFRGGRLRPAAPADASAARGAAVLEHWLETGALSHAVVPSGGLSDAATAHDRVMAGDKLGTVVLSL